MSGSPQTYRALFYSTEHPKQVLAEGLSLYDAVRAARKPFDDLVIRARQEPQQVEVMELSQTHWQVSVPGPEGQPITATYKVEPE